MACKWHEEVFFFLYLTYAFGITPYVTSMLSPCENVFMPAAPWDIWFYLSIDLYLDRVSSLPPLPLMDTRAGPLP